MSSTLFSLLLRHQALELGWYHEGKWGIDENEYYAMVGGKTGALIAASCEVGGILAGYRFLKLPMSAVMGMVSGMHTQPACLAFATQHSGNDMPNEWYASVYPASMIAKILLAQVLVTVMLRM